MLREPVARQAFGASLARLVSETKDESIREAAEALDDLVESGEIPDKHEFTCILYSALGYDIANEPYAARRMYRRLALSKHPDLEHFVISRSNSRLLTSAFEDIGLRDSAKLGDKLSRVKNNLETQKEYMEHVDEAYRDDYTILLSTVYLLGDMIKALAASDGDGVKKAHSTAAKFYEELEKFSPDPWIEIVAALSMQLIGRIAERAVVGLKVPDETKNILREKKILEIWKPQADAVNGLLGGKSVVCSSLPGTGKSFMAYLAASSLEPRAQMAYLVPTRSLSSQVFDDLRDMAKTTRKIAISTRGRIKDDDRLSECDVVVATYEKMGALVRSGKIDPARIKRVVADEIHMIGDEAIGMATEMVLTGLMEHSPQMICFSGLLGARDAALLSEWLGADRVESSWRGAEINEKILLDGTVTTREGGTEKIPLLTKPGVAPREKKIAAAAHYASLAVRDGEAVLISVTSRKDAFAVADKIAKGVRSPSPDNYDVIPIMEKKRTELEAAADKMRGIEPSIPEFGKCLAEMLELGIAFYHADLPRRYREVVEDGVKGKKVDVVVATPALEAGVNMPIKTVVLFDTKIRSADGTKMIDGRRYRNIAGRAGISGCHKAGDVVVIATTREEVAECEEAFWRPEPAPLRSSFFDMVWEESSPTTSAFRAHVLSHVVEHPGSDASEIVKSLRKTWFYTQDQAASDKDLAVAVERSVGMLARHGMIHMGSDGRLSPTQDGKGANESVLTLDAAAIIMSGLRHMQNDADAGEILLLAGLTDDLQEYAKRSKGVTVPDIVGAAADSQSKHEAFGSSDMDTAAKCASMLYYWIEGNTSAEIAKLCNKDPKIGPPVSEDMVADAARVLQSMAALAESGVGKSEIAHEIRRLADACRIGSCDPVVRDLLKLEHAGRDSAIKISRKLAGRRIAEMGRDEFVGIFPDNTGTADVLFQEIRDSLEA